MNTTNSKLDGVGESDRIADLDQQLWDGFEEQLWLRSAYKGEFDVHYFEQQERPWEWLILRCQTWDEVERVLNWHKVQWYRDGYRKIIVKDGMLIFRCA